MSIGNEVEKRDITCNKVYKRLKSLGYKPIKGKYFLDFNYCSIINMESLFKDDKDMVIEETAAYYGLTHHNVHFFKYAGDIVFKLVEDGKEYILFASECE